MHKSFSALAGPAILFMAANAGAYRSPDFGDLKIFPDDNYWHWDISKYQVHPNSPNLVASVGNGAALHPDFGTVYAGAPMGIPFIVVDKSQAKIAVNYTDYGDESDPGPYPIPLTAPVEGGPSSTGDRHVLAVDKDSQVLYELYHAFPRAAQWDASSGAKFDLAINDMHPKGWTSADAAGLPILPGLVRYEEIAKGEINHAIRMTLQNSRNRYIWPASHYASTKTDSNLPPMGMRFRLKAGYDITTFPATAQVVLKALKKHGMIVADNGGNWFISGAPDERFLDSEINTLKRLRGGDFEALLTIDAAGNPIKPTAGIVILGAPLRTYAAGPLYNLLGRRFASKPANAPQLLFSIERIRGNP